MSITRFGSNIQHLDSQGRMGEVPIEFTFVAQGGTGTAPLATNTDFAASGLQGFWMAASTDEFDTLFRVPADYDGSKDSYIEHYFSIASKTATSVDTVRFYGTYQVPSLNAETTKLADATTTTGVTNNTADTITGPDVGVLYNQRVTLTSAATIATGNIVHLQLTAGTTCDEKELRLWRKGVFKYARLYV